MLLQGFLHVYPLWSAVLLRDLCRYSSDKQHPTAHDVTPNRVTNSRVENWFGVCKSTFLHGTYRGQRLRPGDFIKKSYVSVVGRIRETILKQPAKRYLTKKKTKVKDKSKSTGKYFTPPKQMPTPKARQKKILKMSTKEDEPNPQEVWQKRNGHKKQQSS